MDDMKVYIVAEADGKCFKCGRFCMECGCWLQGLQDPFGLLNQPERLNPETYNYMESFFPPPWNINEHPEKTKGWIEFQREMKKDPEYYKMR